MTRLLYRQRNMTLGDDKEEEKPVHKRKISHFEWWWWWCCCCCCLAACGIISSKYWAGFGWRISEAAIAGNAANAACCCCWWWDDLATSAAAVWLATAKGSIFDKKCLEKNSICSLLCKAANVDANVSAGDGVNVGIMDEFVLWLFDELLFPLWWWWWEWEWWLLLVLLLLWWWWWWWWWFELVFVDKGLFECLLVWWACFDCCWEEEDDDDDCLTVLVVAGVVVVIVVEGDEEDCCWNLASSSFSCCNALINACRKRFEWSCLSNFFCDVFVQRSHRILSSVFVSLFDDISCHVTDQSVPHWAQTYGRFIEISLVGRRLTISV